MTIPAQYLANLPFLTLEQKILSDEFFKRFDQGGGAPFDVTAVEPLLYEGVIAGSEFLIYDANKLYLCFDIIFGSSAAATAANPHIEFFDEFNVINFYGQNVSIAYEAVAAVNFYGRNFINVKNLYFSRFTQATMASIKFIGYRITY